MARIYDLEDMVLLIGLRSEKQSIKLAGDRYFIQLQFEPQDSGIDSDDDRHTQAPAFRDGHLQATETSSSDEDPIDKQPWARLMSKDDDDQFKIMEEGRLLPEVQIPLAYRGQNLMQPGSPDRSSPPLYEVELTASDEDDDASVLELVIPVQSSRYNRVPTSSPLKTNLKAPRFFCNLFCCMRS